MVRLLKLSHSLSIKKEQLKIMDNSLRPIFTLKSSFHILRLNQEWMPEWIKQGQPPGGCQLLLRIFHYCYIASSTSDGDDEGLFVCLEVTGNIIFCVGPNYGHSYHEI